MLDIIPNFSLIPAVLRPALKTWSKSQTEELMKIFTAKQYPNKDEMFQLAKLFNCTVKQIEYWFINRRREKRAEGMLLEGE